MAVSADHSQSNSEGSSSSQELPKVTGSSGAVTAVSRVNVVKTCLSLFGATWATTWRSPRCDLQYPLRTSSGSYFVTTSSTSERIPGCQFPPWMSKGLVSMTMMGPSCGLEEYTKSLFPPQRMSLAVLAWIAFMQTVSWTKTTSAAMIMMSRRMHATSTPAHVLRGPSWRVRTEERYLVVCLDATTFHKSSSISRMNSRATAFSMILVTSRV
mmetsp:Transcript_3348/g.7853  ORF Transcript_3348/g.7853 Transcript_3348/m.7853 type:complete len:212 (-) Transcript_3348:1051-1686(-)